MKSEKRNLSASSPSYIPREERDGLGRPAADALADYSSLSDQELLELIAQENREALSALYDRYAGAVYSLAVQILRDQGAAEEVVQDTFFNVWRRATTYKPDRGKVTAWLFSIGHHRGIDELRRRRRREEKLVYHDVDLSNQPADEVDDPARYAAVQMRRGKVKEMLSVLREEQRQVVMLAYYGGLTHSEIAARLDQPLGTVKTRMRLALKKLRETMGPQAHEWAEYEL